MPNDKAALVREVLPVTLSAMTCAGEPKSHQNEQKPADPPAAALSWRYVAGRCGA